MTKLKYILILFLLQSHNVFSQNLKQEQLVESQWDQGVPIHPTDFYVQSLINSLDSRILSDLTFPITKNDAVICREIAIAFYNRGIYDSADWYLNRAKSYVEVVEIQPEIIVKETPAIISPKITNATEEQLKSLEQDAAFLESIPNSYDNLSQSQLSELAKRINAQIEKLNSERTELVKNNASKEVIDTKDKTITHLEKEKHVIDLTVNENKLKTQTNILKTERQNLYRYLIITGIIIAVLFLLVAYFALRKRIAYKESVIRKQNNKFNEFEQFVDSSVLVSKTDAHGKIIYVNEKFQQVSGWTSAEALGQDHRIVNSGYHTKEFWQNMYDVTVNQRKIWNEVVTNKSKSGELYYVDTYIRAIFDRDGNLEGFSSIRQDVTELKKKEVEIRNRMTAINKSNAAIEFDLDGNIIFANNLFLETMGYSCQDELVGKHHSIFVDKEYSKTNEYLDFWQKLKNGILFSDEITRIRKDGSIVYLQATYNPIIGIDGKTYRIMKIATDITDSYKQKIEIEKQNTYLEHAAKILRHDMHSGINTYIPRGISSLERRLTADVIQTLKLEAPLKMIREGLTHTQKVYKGVYEFTNLVKKDVVLNKASHDLKQILESYLNSTSYKSQVIIEDLVIADVNDSLFCTAVDNLIRNGLKYNDNATKFVRIFIENGELVIQDNGRGLTQEEFNHLSKPYTRKPNQTESGTGLGLNICVAILTEHGFTISCDKNEIGTKIKINMGV
jgi:PAS domain S-box-containing protein